MIKIKDMIIVYLNFPHINLLFNTKPIWSAYCRKAKSEAHQFRSQTQLKSRSSRKGL